MSDRTNKAMEAFYSAFNFWPRTIGITDEMMQTEAFVGQLEHAVEIGDSSSIDLSSFVPENAEN